MIKEELDKLTTNDIYSLVLFAILQLRKDPKYAVLSELIYVLDRDGLLKLCKQFGGMTITIPTTDELRVMVNALLLYCYVNLENQPLEESLELCSTDEDRELVLQAYDTITCVVSDYDFRRN